MKHELEKRGIITHTGGGTLEDIFSKKRNVYLGIDPSADSLHVGNLVPIILMKHLSELGHTPHFLVGGATGLIGDPRESGERPLLDSKIVSKNTNSIKKQLLKILERKNLQVFNNATWLSRLSLLDFLRGTGKHFTVNQLIKRDIIKRRLQTEEDSISFTEFSYPLLQAYDYLHLYINKKIDLQIGGSDQWSNIISGVDLIRRKQNVSAYALTTPIVTDKSTGKKFGKSEGNAVWLDPEKTSPFAFYQFWLNVSDENVEEYMKIFTFLPLSEISVIVSEQQKSPQSRVAQKTLAKEITKFVHGSKIAIAVEKVSRIIFHKDFELTSLSAQEKRFILKELPSAKIKKSELNSGFRIAEAILKTELANSKSDARRLLAGGGISVNGAPVDTEYTLQVSDFKSDLVLIRKGKKMAVLEIEH